MSTSGALGFMLEEMSKPDVFRKLLQFADEVGTAFANSDENDLRNQTPKVHQMATRLGLIDGKKAYIVGFQTEQGHVVRIPESTISNDDRYQKQGGLDRLFSKGQIPAPQLVVLNRENTVELIEEMLCFARMLQVEYSAGYAYFKEKDFQLYRTTVQNLKKMGILPESFRLGREFQNLTVVERMAGASLERRA